MLLQCMSDTHALQERDGDKIPDLFIILGCGQQQQKETLPRVWTEEGQKNTIYMYEVQEVHAQHTQWNSGSHVLYIGSIEKSCVFNGADVLSRLTWLLYVFSLCCLNWNEWVTFLMKLK